MYDADNYMCACCGLFSNYISLFKDGFIENLHIYAEKSRYSNIYVIAPQDKEVSGEPLDDETDVFSSPYTFRTTASREEGDIKYMRTPYPSANPSRLPRSKSADLTPPKKNYNHRTQYSYRTLAPTASVKFMRPISPP